MAYPSDSVPAIPGPSDQSGRRSDSWWVALLLADFFFVGMRVWGMAAYCMDGDELFSLAAARQDLAGLMTTAIKDISHPPLFYLLLKLWIAIGGESLVWLRALPVLIGSLTLIPLHLLCRELKLKTSETVLVLLMLGANAFLIFYDQHLRMFVLLEFFAAWSMWAFAALLNRPQITWAGWVSLFVINLGLVYSHYWGWVLLGTEFLLLLAMRRDRVVPVFLIGMGLVAAFAPWAYCVVHEGITRGSTTSQIAWMTKPTLFHFVWFFGKLDGTLALPRSTLAGLLLFGAPVVLLAARARWRPLRQGLRENSLYIALAVLATLPVVGTFALSHLLKQSVWAERQLMYVAIPYAILIALAWGRMPSAWARAIWASAIAIWVLAAGITAKCDNYDEKIAWDSLVAHIRTTENGAANEPIPIYVVEGFVATPMEFYANHGRSRWLDVRTERDPQRWTGDHFWIAFRDTTWREKDQPQQILARMGYRIDSAAERGTDTQNITVFSARK